MLITDAQMHLWEPDRPERPWPQPPRSERSPEVGFSGEQAVAAMDEVGVDRTVIVPPFWAGERNDYAIEVASRYPGRFAVMGRFDTTASDAEEQLATWLDQPNMLGIRVSFLANPRPEQVDDGSLEWMWSACERHGIPLMMLFSTMAEKARPIVERHPGLTVILDHMALNLRRPPGEAWESLEHVIPLAAFPNVFVKVSSVPNFSVELAPYRDTVPHVRRLYDAFGPHRLFWGSDLTRLRGSYADCLSQFREDLDFLSEEDRDLILGGALSECLNWPSP